MAEKHSGEGEKREEKRVDVFDMPPAAENSSRKFLRFSALAKRAVGLSYRPQSSYDAPKIIASGKGARAETIIKHARAAHIPIEKNASLAELLSVLEIGQEIPPEAFLAVAEILRYIYAQRGWQPPYVENE